MSQNQCPEPIKAQSNVIDVSLAYNHLFNAAAKKAMSIRVKGIDTVDRTLNVNAQNKIVTDKIVYFGEVARGDESIIKAARHLADTVNGFANDGLVTGLKLPLSIIKVETEPHQLNTYCLALFLSMTTEGYEKAQGSCRKNQEINYTVDSPEWKEMITISIARLGFE